MTHGVEDKQFHGKVTAKNKAVAIQAPKKASRINIIQTDSTIQQKY